MNINILKERIKKVQQKKLHMMGIMVQTKKYKDAVRKGEFVADYEMRCEQYLEICEKERELSRKIQSFHKDKNLPGRIDLIIVDDIIGPQVKSSALLTLKDEQHQLDLLEAKEIEREMRSDNNREPFEPKPIPIK